MFRKLALSEVLCVCGNPSRFVSGFHCLDWTYMFLLLSIKVKTRDFRVDGRETIDRGREMLVTFGKLSVNFWKLSGKT